MNIPDNWRKSSHSGAGDGNSCVEISTSTSHTAIRDSKTPTTGVLTFPRTTFSAFVEALKTHSLDGEPRT